jgi:protein O-mannosyl-transferase
LEVDVAEFFMKEPKNKLKTRAAVKSKLSANLPASQSLLTSDSLKSAVLCSLILIALNLAIYAPAWRYGFLSWDDPSYVSQNAEVSHGLTYQGCLWAFTTGHASNWHPLTWLSHMLDVQLFGKIAGFHHLSNILLHIANSILLFWAICRMTGAWRPSAVVAALFAVHPQHVESVVWIAERKDVLSAFFCILTFHAYIGYVRRPQLNRYLTVLALFALGLMSKPMLVALPFLLLLLDLWPLRRVHLSTGQLKLWRHLVSEKIPLFALSAASSIVTIMIQWRGGAVSSFETIPLGQRTANILFSYAAYIVQMLWPKDLVAYYPYNPLPLWLAGGSLMALAAASFFVFRLARTQPYALVGWLWYLVALLPVIGLIQVGDQARADRYTYLPSIGLFIIVTWSAPLLLSRLRHRNVILCSAAAIMICALTAAARTQVRYWENDLTLWTHTVEKRGTNNYLAHMQLGSALADSGELTSAIEQYTESLRINAAMPAARIKLGLAYFKQGRFSEALMQYNEAIRLNPRSDLAYIDRGILSGTQGERGQAIEDFLTALKINPDNAEAHYNLGYTLADDGKTDEAIAHFNETLRINPEHAHACNRLGTALASQGKADESIVQYARAIIIESNFWEARVNLGVALMHQNRDSEALGQFMEALRIKPDLAQVHNNVGVILSNQEKTAEAIIHFNEALRLYPDSVEIRENLRSALAVQGNNR